MNRPERAKREDAAEILALYRAAAKAANQSGYSHWDEDYPNRETIRDDLENGYLYVWREDGRIAAAITYMHPYDLDGLGISWTPVERAVEACRFCLSPSQQGKGRAKAYFLGGMELLRAQGVEATVGAVDGVLLLLQLFGVTRHMYCPFLRKLRQSNVPQGRYESSGLRRATPVRRTAAASVSSICVLKWENHRKRVSVLWISGVLWKVVG